MKQSKDPFEAAYEEQEETPPDSPVGPDELDTQTPAAASSQDPVVVEEDDDIENVGVHPADPSASAPTLVTARSKAKNKEDDEDEEEDNMDVELSRFPSSADPDKMAKMQFRNNEAALVQRTAKDWLHRVFRNELMGFSPGARILFAADASRAILSQFTEEQMSRYESFRRSALQKANMRRLLVSITGSQKISLPMTIVVCGIAKMFVGELVETARMVMTERKESGPIRPCHIREAYRRLKLEGKVPRKSVPRLFR